VSVPNRKVAVVHGAVAPDAPPDEQNSLEEVEIVAEALERLGWDPVAVPMTLDVATAKRRLQALAPAFVFNLVESLDGKGIYIHVGPTLFDALGLPFTGCGTEAILQTQNKVIAKRIMAKAGLPTPDWIEPGDLLAGRGGKPGQRYIVKSAWEHASVGLDGGSVAADPAELRRIALDRRARFGGDWFAEEYIEGAEFHLPMIGPRDAPEAVVGCIIDFIDFAPGEAKLFDYDAKWNEGTPSFDKTPDRLADRPGDRALIARATPIAFDCWRFFGLSGYARIDFRIDEAGRPFVIDINANPCLSYVDSLPTGAVASGIDFDALIRRIVEAAGIVPPPPRPRAAKPSGGAASLAWRSDLVPEDVETVRALVRSTGFFTAAEEDVAAELVEDALERGTERTGYHFLFAEEDGRAVGYSCYGPIMGTDSSWDLYWIVVGAARRGGGLGRAINARTEKAVAALGGRRLYAETSGRAQYEPTRAFYLKTGYREVGRIENFYAEGDAKVIFEKSV